IFVTNCWGLTLRATTMLSGLALAGSLAGCASAPPPPPVAAPVVQSVAQNDYEGVFKVGKPYQVDGKWYYPSEDYGYSQEGIASWYGQDFQGKRTANGERYDMN